MKYGTSNKKYRSQRIGKLRNLATPKLVEAVINASARAGVQKLLNPQPIKFKILSGKTIKVIPYSQWNTAIEVAKAAPDVAQTLEKVYAKLEEEGVVFGLKGNSLTRAFSSSPVIEIKEIRNRILAAGQASK